MYSWERTPVIQFKLEPECVIHQSELNIDDSHTHAHKSAKNKRTHPRAITSIIKWNHNMPNGQCTVLGKCDWRVSATSQARLPPHMTCKLIASLRCAKQFVQLCVANGQIVFVSWFAEVVRMTTLNLVPIWGTLFVLWPGSFRHVQNGGVSYVS